MAESLTQIAEFFDGIQNPKDYQTISDVKPGDPQFAALSQYILGKRSGGQNSVIADYGSGGGVLAHVMDELWSGAKTPHYAAIDKDDPLNQLSLPVRIHNNSSKIRVADFKTWLIENASRIEVVAIRNVLHELSISETASLFHQLLETLPTQAEIYIQDMENLPRAERNRAGWQIELLAPLLAAIGFSVTHLARESHSGTKWYALTASVRERKATLEQVTAECIEARKTQLTRIGKELADPRTPPSDYVRLQSDLGAISLQMMNTTAITDVPVYPLEKLGVCTIPKQKFGPRDFAESADEFLNKMTGLSAVVSRKSILDFSSQLSRCKRRACFSGLSLRKFFSDSESRVLCERLVYKIGGQVRLLMSDPRSQFAELRSLEPAYGGDAQTFVGELEGAIEDAKRFYEDLCKTYGEPNPERIDFRVTDKIMYSSCVILDELALVSEYTHYTTGSGGLCWVYSANESSSNSVFRSVEADFDYVWGLATSIVR